MSSSGTRQTTPVRTGVQLPDRGKTRGPARWGAAIDLKEAVFERMPAELGRLLTFADDGEGQEIDPEAAELLSLDESEVELVDEDEYSADEAASERELCFPVGAGEDLLGERSPVLSPGEVYSLVVLPARDPGGRLSCSFEPPRWMHNRLPDEAAPTLKQLRGFLYTLAAWLEAEKQAFLADPTPENFVKGETFRFDDCVLIQQHLLQRLQKFREAHPQKCRVKARTAKKGEDEDEKAMSESYLSRLRDKIWLFGPKWNLPLGALYSEPHRKSFREAWVVAGGAARYADAEDGWRERRYPEGFSATDVKRMKEQSPEVLDPEQYLYMLCLTVELGKEFDRLFAGVIDRVSKTGKADGA